MNGACSTVATRTLQSSASPALAVRTSGPGDQITQNVVTRIEQLRALAKDIETMRRDLMVRRAYGKQVDHISLDMMQRKFEALVGKLQDECTRCAIEPELLATVEESDELQSLQALQIEETNAPPSMHAYELSANSEPSPLVKQQLTTTSPSVIPLKPHTTMAKILGQPSLAPSSASAQTTTASPTLVLSISNGISNAQKSAPCLWTPEPPQAEAVFSRAGSTRSSRHFEPSSVPPTAASSTSSTLQLACSGSEQIVTPGLAKSLGTPRAANALVGSAANPLGGCGPGSRPVVTNMSSKPAGAFRAASPSEAARNPCTTNPSRSDFLRGDHVAAPASPRAPVRQTHLREPTLKGCPSRGGCAPSVPVVAPMPSNIIDAEHWQVGTQYGGTPRSPIPTPRSQLQTQYGIPASQSLGSACLPPRSPVLMTPSASPPLPHRTLPCASLVPIPTALAKGIEMRPQAPQSPVLTPLSCRSVPALGAVAATSASNLHTSAATSRCSQTASLGGMPPQQAPPRGCSHRNPEPIHSSRTPIS